MNTNKIMKDVEKRMQAVAAERDKLDEFILELESLREDCQQAWELLHDARDALSELV